MKQLNFTERDEWLFARRGKITGTRLEEIVVKTGPSKDAIVAELELQKIEFKKSDKKEDLEKLLSPESARKLKSQLEKKLAYYELIAERLTIPSDDENETPMERGTRLESAAIERFVQETGKYVDTSLVIWTRDDNESIAVSPDGIVSDEEVVETKCLSSARHIRAFLLQEVPDDYRMQVIQYFIVNDKLQTLNLAFYDPRVVVKDFFILTVKREEIAAQIEEYLEYQKMILEMVDGVVNSLTF